MAEELQELERGKFLETLVSKTNCTWIRSMFTKSCGGYLSKVVLASSQY